MHTDTMESIWNKRFCIESEYARAGENIITVASTGSSLLTKMSPLCSIAWLYGPMAAGACFVLIGFIFNDII